MVLNARCNDCKEPTKYVAGCWDGINGIGGFIYICKNEECEIKQIVRTMEAEDITRRLEVQTANGQKGIFAGQIAALRKEAGLSMYKMSQIAGVRPSEYCDYERERKEFDPEAYRRCMEYLKNN